MFGDMCAKGVATNEMKFISFHNTSIKAIAVHYKQINICVCWKKATIKQLVTLQAEEIILATLLAHFSQISVSK